MTSRPRQLAFRVPSPAAARAAVPRTDERPEQLTISRCPHCAAFLTYRGVGRRRITCGAPACRKARRNARLRSLREPARARSVVLTLIIAALVRRRRSSP